ncbi:MAG TPA: DNA damage-inducible protein D [Candidatus Nanoarchaeia archaeon]|nr:DNA damage-inducible protein D [Candidatus Nanoarchaeia archaeon]
MEKAIIATLQKSFEDYVHKEKGVEFWFARDLQKLLGYVEWRKFLRVIEKAKEACKNSNNDIQDHFVGAANMVKIGSETEREIEDYKLTRYACYLVAQNGDSRKEEIAFAQSYFALQTRKQELIEQRIALQERFEARNKLIASETELSKLIYERGVDDAGFARIRSKGDEALFGGKDTKQMKNKLNIPQNRPMADFLPTVTIAAKNLATEITNFNVKHNDLHGEPKITGEHVKNNIDVRGLLSKSGIKPEELPPEEDLIRLQNRIKSEDKTIAENSKRKAQKKLL